jgi:hypothetical protein
MATGKGKADKTNDKAKKQAGDDDKGTSKARGKK